jgi:hypothetical protein
MPSLLDTGKETTFMFHVNITGGCLTCHELQCVHLEELLCSPEEGGA